MTAYEMLVAAETALTSQAEAKNWLIAQGVKQEKAATAAARFWTERHPPPPPIPSQPPPPPPPPVSSPFLVPQPGAHQIWADDCKLQDPLSLYGAFVGGRKDGKASQFTIHYDEIAPGRLVQHANGGPDGLPFRSITVLPQDENWGVRDALGYNWSEPNDPGWGLTGPGPTVLWHEGQYRLLTLWLKLGQINTTGYFRQLVEIKQAEPYVENQPWHGAMFELQQRENKWLFINQWNDGWRPPLVPKVDEWVPISIEGFFSADPSKGWMRFKIGDITSPLTKRQTLLRNDSNGQPTDSFMELGPYQDHALGTMSLGVADVRVYGD